MKSNQIYSFGDYQLNLSEARLSKFGANIPLTPKVFDMLLYLIERQGLLVTKDELLDSLWGRRYVTEGVLKSTVKLLRLALDDDCKSPRYLETVHRRGYRFIAEVSVQDHTLVPASGEQLSSRAPLPLLVGRETELEQLRKYLAVAANGMPQLVFVTGEAGIGKTTLIEHWLAAGISPFILGRGQCIEQYGHSEPYLPILEAIGNICREQGEEAITILGSTAPDWLVELPWLATAIRANPPQNNSPARMLRELGELLEQWTSRFPLLIILEDLHWSDRATLEALAYLARRKSQSRWLILASFRSEQNQDNPAFWQITRDLQIRGLASEIALPLLTESAVAEYLNACSGTENCNPELIRAIYKRSEGLPFFVAQLVNSVRQSEYVSYNELPSGLQHLLEQQYQRLSLELQELLAAAAVAGPVFGAPLLAELTQKPPEETEKQCEWLARGGNFIGRAPKQADHYHFLHAYFQEFVYQSLAAIAKAQLHRQTADWLERQIRNGGMEESAAAVALHFERGGLFDKAVDYLQQAADHAVKRQANNEVIELTKRALQLLSHHLPQCDSNTRRKIWHYSRMGMAMRALQGYGRQEQSQVYEQALALAKQINDMDVLLPLLKAQSYFHLVRLELEPCHHYAEQLLDLAVQHDLRHFQLSANLILAGVQFFRGSSAFTRYAEAAAALYSPDLDSVLLSYSAQHPLASLGYMRAWHLWLQGRPQLALLIQQQSLAAVESVGHAVSIAFSCVCTAGIHQLRGEWLAMASFCERAVILAEEYDLEVLLRWSQILQGYIAVKQGEVEAGLSAMRQGLYEYLGRGSRGISTYQLLDCYAEVCLVHRRLDEVGRILQQLQILMGENAENFFRAEYYRIKGELLLASDPPADGDAEALFRKALSIATEQDAKSLALRAATSLAKRYLTENRAYEGKDLLQQVYAEFSEGHDTRDLQQARALLDRSG